MKDLSVFSNYLSRQQLYEFDYLSQSVEPDIIVVIPCHNETTLIESLVALKATSVEGVNQLVIVVINHGVEASEVIFKTNEKTFVEAKQWGEDHCFNNFQLGLIKAYDLTKKKAGVGLARKIGMDKATSIYLAAKKDGLISCYDADSRCASNYISVLQSAFINNPKVDGYSIYYEHPIDGSAFQKDIYDAIIQYESHLRYFILMQKDLGLPFAYQTVGSSMAVKASSYAKLGGMNQRKAGEDFYFLQKFIENGKVLELNDTVVIPSPRISDRVPFGTGKAIGDLLAYDDTPIYLTYHPNSFYDLRSFVQSIERLYTEDIDRVFKTYPEGVQAYFNLISFKEKVLEARKNTSSIDSFRSRIFKHFNAFQLMKYVHFMRDHYYPNVSIEDACRIRLGGEQSMLDYLKELRTIDLNKN